MDFRTALLMNLINYHKKHILIIAMTPYMDPQDRTTRIESYHRMIERAMRHMEKPRE